MPNPADFKALALAAKTTRNLDTLAKLVLDNLALIQTSADLRTILGHLKNDSATGAALIFFKKDLIQDADMLLFCLNQLMDKRTKESLIYEKLPVLEKSLAHFKEGEWEESFTDDLKVLSQLLLYVPPHAREKSIEQFLAGFSDEAIQNTAGPQEEMSPLLKILDHLPTEIRDQPSLHLRFKVASQFSHHLSSLPEALAAFQLLHPDDQKAFRRNIIEKDFKQASIQHIMQHSEEDHAAHELKPEPSSAVDIMRALQAKGKSAKLIKAVKAKLEDSHQEEKGKDQITGASPYTPPGLHKSTHPENAAPERQPEKLTSKKSSLKS